ncbi:D-alanyl-D-alanine carboxypeptidase family protein [Luteimonas terricola]|uniref:serine-type D-Ala-D-Ala carboxypeptidase n=1 Tax=Luteimonas terricola TaxID=645597 RepID=A0ABQ2E9S5_9GAMM|nr:D-alanyl-D-alanine carboxypeptidase family protein [Luteimonas terricola]GGJ97979.1 D-alanyl-D-alanine carboxypeptidase [Luteimonas terricola]
MKVHAVRVALFAAVSVATLGLAFAQDPAPTAAAPAPAALSEQLPVPDAPAIIGTAWALMDYATGQVLAGDNVDERVEPASITKVMTSYVIAAEMKAGKLQADDDVMMSVNAWRSGGAGTDGSYSGFEVNKTAKLIEMVKGMVVQSGNDAAIALAEHVAGSEDAFAALMNAYAARIGMENTHFVNSHGLSAPEHYSTARDLALLGRALARDFPDHYAYNSIKEFKVGRMDAQLNRNVLLWRDQSVDGIKTGHHSGAGYCLMASAKRGDQRLISVVMGSTSESQRATDSQALLNWGFRFFETHELYAAGEPVATQKIWKGQANEIGLGVAQPLLVSMQRGQYAKLQPSMDVPRTLVAPLERGQAVGMVRVMLDGKLVAEAPLVALEEVPEAGFFKRLWHELLMWWQSV